MVSSETSLTDLVGQAVGPYRLVRRLGIGGMAETFEALRSGPAGFEQRVCLKLVLPFYNQDPKFVELFQREAKLAARLNHSNIVRVIDFGEIDGRAYMALQLVDGADLQRLVEGTETKRLPYELVALLGLDLAAGLAHAHDPSGSDSLESGPVIGGVVHRDLSPSNVLISKHGEVLVSDFGVAKAITATARQQSAVKGKVPYMSPEQLRGEAVDGRSDLFSLGVVLFEALGGQRPFQGANDPATILQILNGEHPALHTLASDAPVELCHAIERMLSPDVEARPQTAQEVVESFDPFTTPRSVRRQLGELAMAAPRPVESAVPEVASSVVGKTGAPPADARAPTEPMDGAITKDPPKRGRAVAVAALMVALAAGAYFSLRSANPEEPSVESVPAANPTPVAAEEPEAPAPAEATTQREEPPTVEPIPPETPTREAALAPAQKKTQPKPAPAAPSKVRVVVIPWGDVWIDGEAVGPAPVKNRVLKPGRHTIAAGQGSPTEKRTVRVKRGQDLTVKFDLRDAR